MLQDLILKGSTDRSVTLRCLDSTTGAPKTDVVFNSAGIDLWYRRELSAVVSITEVTLAALTTAHADGGFLHISNGYYRLDLPDAAFATGANYVEFGGTVTGGHFIGGKVKLVNVNLEDAVRMGLTALPNAAAEAAGGLYTRGTGAGQINQANNGQVDANAARTGGTTNTGRDIGASVLLSSGTGTGQLSLSSGLVTLAGVTHTGAVIPTVTTVTTLTGHTAQTGDAYARLGAPAGASVSADVAAVKADTAAVKTKTDFLPSATAGAAGGVFIAGTNAATTITTALTTTFTGNLTGSVGSVSGLTAATVHADLDDIQARLPAALVSGRMDASVGAMAANVLTAAATAADYLAEINTEADTAIADAALATAANLATLSGYVDTEIAAIKAVTDKMDDTLEDDGGTYRFTANALEQAPSGSGASAATIADAVWDEVLSGHLTAGSTGAALNAAGGAGDPWITALPGSYISGQAGYIVGTNLNATVSSRATQTSVDDLPTNAELATALGTADDATLTAIAALPAAPSAAAVADAVWDEATTGHTTSGTFGEQLKTDIDALLTNVDAIPTNAELATALGTSDDAILAVLGAPAGASLAADIAAIEAQTDDIGAAGAGLTALASAASVATLTTYVDTEVAAIKAKTDLIPASPVAVGDVPTATQNADALLNRDMSAVSDTNARSPLNALRFLRNKWSITAGTLSVKKENDSTEAWNAAVSTTPGADPVTGNDPA